MPQSRLFFSVDKTEAEQIYDILERAFEDDGFPIAITEIDEDRQISEVSVYTEDGAEELAARVDALVGAGKFETEELPDIDWVTHSLEGLKPVRAGRFFVHGSHDRDKLQPNEIPILIDAGLAFGTGHHGTTSGCLEMIEEVVEREHPTNALDLEQEAQCWQSLSPSLHRSRFSLQISTRLQSPLQPKTQSSMM